MQILNINNRKVFVSDAANEHTENQSGCFLLNGKDTAAEREEKLFATMWI
jgi:hypothetical protein